MQTIHKFPLALVPRQTLMMPAHCSILSAGEQNGDLMLWARLNTAHPHFGYEIAIVGTGQPMPDETDTVYWQFISTVQAANGFVWHVFIKLDLNDQPAWPDEVPE